METRNTGHARTAIKGSARIQRFGIVVILLVLCSAVFADAQEEHRFTADVFGGVTPLSGRLSDRLDTGWNIGVSGGINFNSIFSTSLRYSFNRFGVSPSLLQLVGTPDGHSNIWSVTLDPKVQLGTHLGVRPYVVGAVGYYRRMIDFTRPVIVRAVFFDPVFDIPFSTLVVQDVTVRSVTRGGVGGNLGAGFDIKLGESGLKAFSEARYEYADAGNVPTRMIPVRFGLRW